MKEQEKIVVVDFGSQYVQLIARRVREQSTYCEIVTPDVSPSRLKVPGLKGLIFSGGPASVYAKDAPRCSPELLKLGVPVLGICYGMQLGCLLLGADVRPARNREYGGTHCRILDHQDLFHGLPDEMTVWMSHGDMVERVPDDFSRLAETNNCPCAAVRHTSRTFFGVQFHPEVAHTPFGTEVLGNFVRRICGCTGQWRMTSFIEEAIDRIREQVKDGRVVCGLSGGVDSSVVAALIHRAIGDRLTCILVDNGLLREGEAEAVMDAFQGQFGADVRLVDASERFLSALRGVTNPEKKRKIIGHEFIAVFKEAARQIGDVQFLAQGTLYPDVIESTSAKGGPSATIKSHHNVGGLPKELGFTLVEPLRDLFKDEVRKIGEELGLPSDLVWRQPFPGPGLAVRIVGEVTPDRLQILRHADRIVQEEIRPGGWDRKTWQTFAVLLPIQSVGVMGDERSYEYVVAIRSVQSVDAMTADWTRLPSELLARMSSRIINEVRGVNRVVYDISTKPPSTIEWE